MKNQAFLQDPRYFNPPLRLSILPRDISKKYFFYICHKSLQQFQTQLKEALPGGRGCPITQSRIFFPFSRNPAQISLVSTHHTNFHFHEITQIFFSFSRHHAHKKYLLRITHGGRFTQSRNNVFIFTLSRNKKGLFTQSRIPMGGLLKHR